MVELARSLVLPVALTVAVCGCSSPSRQPLKRPVQALAGACTATVTSWAVTLAGASPATSYDYQEMGLSDAQYDVLRDVMTHRTGGALRAAEKERIAALCRTHYGAATSAPRQHGHSWPHG